MGHWCIAILSLGVAIAGCSGGGGDGDVDGASATAPDAGRAFGLWEGTTSDGRTTAGLVLPTREYWFIYTAVGNSAAIAGVVQGDLDDSNGKFTSFDGKDFSFEGAGIIDLTIDGSYVQKQSLSGTVKYKNSSATATFTTQYNADWEAPASLAAIEGAYTGAAYAGFTEYAEVTVSATGALSGQSASGCSYRGTVSPSSNGNFYSVSVTFQDAICANGTTSLASYAYYSAATKTLYSVGLNAARDNGFIFVGTRP